jgi:hypothetical protein
MDVESEEAWGREVCVLLSLVSLVQWRLHLGYCLCSPERLFMSVQYPTLPILNFACEHSTQRV